MIGQFRSRRFLTFFIATILLLLVYQNCGDVRIKGFKETPSTLETPLPTPPPQPVASPPPTPAPPVPTPGGPPPAVVDGGTPTGAVNLGLTLIFRVFESIEWSPSGHFVATGPCSPTRQVGQNGWPGGQFLFDREGNYLTMAHVCRDSGWSGVCPDGGCNLGNNISFVSPDTFVRFAQLTDTPGDQRAPMLYKIQNNRFAFKGQLFTPHYPDTVNETYPNNFWGINGTVVGDTMIILKSKGRTPVVPPPSTYQQQPFRQGFYKVNANSLTTPFEFLFDWPDFQPQTINPAFSVGPMVLSTDGKVYRFANNTFTFVRDLTPLSVVDGYQNYALKDSTDPNAFYLRPISALNNLRKYRYQDNTIVDLGEIVAGPNEYVLTASGNIVLKWKSFENDSRNCPQRSEMIVEVNGQRVPMPLLTWDLNQVSNEICERSTSGACANWTPLPLPGQQCRSEGAKGAAISPDGVILYIELLTQRIRKLKVQNF